MSKVSLRTGTMFVLLDRKDFDETMTHVKRLLNSDVVTDLKSFSETQAEMIVEHEHAKHLGHSLQHCLREGYFAGYVPLSLAAIMFTAGYTNSNIVVSNV